MRVCVIVYNLLDFGGLEEFAKNLAIGVHRKGVEVSVLSAGWVPPDNQYLRGFRQEGITFVQLPKWISDLTTHWETKEKLLAGLMRILAPLVLLLSFFHFLGRRKSWKNSYTSSRNWLQGQILNRFIAPDQRKPYVRILLNWWRLRWRPDLLHIHGYTNNLLFVIDWADKHQIPVVYEEHQTPDAQFDWWKDFQRSINKASRVVAVSKKSAQGLRDVAGVTRPITVAYYMVPDPQEEGWVESARAADDGDVIRITTPARLYVTKGLPYLLEAIVKVQKVHPQARFKVYGDGPLREELLEYARRLGLDSEQIFVGAYTSRGELSQIMAQTDIFVLSSILEGLPISLLEAMSYGRAVVATPVGGIPEAIQDHVNGLLCAPGDVDCLAQKICTLIEHPELRRKLGEAARKTYEQGPFTPDAVCTQYIAIYQEILAERL
jgi:glycosyltransferase involved in cell wall biosynthesis